MADATSDVLLPGIEDYGSHASYSILLDIYEKKILRFLAVKLFPLLNAPKPATKPTTMKRFDAVFSSMNLLMRLAGWSFAQTLHSLLTLLYNRVVSLSFGDASRTAGALKFSRSYYLAALRGGKAFARLSMPGSSPLMESYSGKGTRDDRIMERIIDFRLELEESGLDRNSLIMFDRIVFAVLSFDRIMTFSVDADFSTITEKSSFVYDTEGSYFSNLPLLMERLGITPEEFWKRVRHHAKRQHHEIMSTGGVNGPASWTAFSDAKAILGNTKLFNSFSLLAKQMGMTWLLQDLVSVVSIPSHDGASDALLQTGRLHSFEEWGGKCRIVAIVDYWSQILLSPLHNAIFDFLSAIESDGTFNQDAACERVRQFTATSGAEVFSFDLTAATDRLPVIIQWEILNYLCPGNYAANWMSLLVDREYYYSATGKSYKYAVGQPMGAKSSWAMLALTHHALVQQASLSAGSEPYMAYALLGDDITLTGTTVATTYRTLMKGLDVSINMSKSIVHHAGDIKSAAEFCKRVYLNGVELTSLPVKLTAKTIMNGRLAPQLQNELYRRGIDTKAKWLLAWLAALIDSESGRFLVVLNALPSSVSSILNPLHVEGVLSEVKSWYGSDHNLTVNDIKEAFTYVAVTEQLKRIDSLLRQAQIIHSAIETNAFGYSTFDAAKILGWNYSDPEVDLKKLAATMPQLSATHPVLKASQYEMDRLSALLADIRSGDTRVVEQARARMLDMFRSALVDNWADPGAARAQAERSLVQKALTLLTEIILNRSEKTEGRSAHFVDFTINLAYINRLWTVSWKLGSTVQINAVKSKIIVDAIEAENNLTTLFTSTSIKELFAAVPRVSKGRKQARVNQTPVAKQVKATAAEVLDRVDTPS